MEMVSSFDGRWQFLMVAGNDKFYALHRDVLMNVWMITGYKIVLSDFIQLNLNSSKSDESIATMYFMNTGVSVTDISVYQKGHMEGHSRTF